MIFRECFEDLQLYIFHLFGQISPIVIGGKKSCIFTGSECLSAGHGLGYPSLLWIILNVLIQYSPLCHPALAIFFFFYFFCFPGSTPGTLQLPISISVFEAPLGNRWMARFQPHLPTSTCSPHLALRSWARTSNRVLGVGFLISSSPNQRFPV